MSNRILLFGPQYRTSDTARSTQDSKQSLSHLKPAIPLVFLILIIILSVLTAAAFSIRHGADNTAGPTVINKQLKQNEYSSLPQATSEKQRPLNESDGNNTNTVRVESVTNNEDSKTLVQINGQEVPLDSNGSVTRTIDTPNGQITTTVQQQSTIPQSPSMSSTSTTSIFSSNSQNLSTQSDVRSTN